MGRLHKRYLEGPRIYACIDCGTHLSTADLIMSKQFHGRGGRAYLFHNAYNFTIGPIERRVLITGLHSVADIFCIGCDTCCGWTYKEAHEESQKYKEGKFILEKVRLQKEEW